MGSGVRVRAIVLSRFALDGGAMHGIVPRTLWGRIHEADEAHRIPLVARAVLVETSSARTLIDPGMGQRWSGKERRIYALSQGDDAPEALRAAGVDPETVTHVVLTHLHWDHAGGAVRREGGLAFPKAEHVIGEVCLGHAARPSDKDRGSFRPEDVALLLREGKVRRWRAGEALAPGLEGRLSFGHTEGLVIPLVRARDDGPPLSVPTDLIPTRSHLKPAWVMAYDNLPATSVAEKQALMEELCAMGGGIALYHDPVVEAAWAVRGERGVELLPGTLDGTR